MGRIVHACGHAQDHYLIGTYAVDCDRQAARLARQACDPCRRASAEQVAVEQHGALQDLTPAALQGSPRQVAWAETIRAKHLAALAGSDWDAAQALARISDAAWWIERRAAKVGSIVASPIG